jgi:hypothetical protein
MGGMRIRQGKGLNNVLQPNFGTRHNNGAEGKPSPVSNTDNIKVSTPFLDRVGVVDNNGNISYQ